MMLNYVIPQRMSQPLSKTIIYQMNIIVMYVA